MWLLNNRCNSGLFQFCLFIHGLFLQTSGINRRRTIFLPNEAEKEMAAKIKNAAGTLVVVNKDQNMDILIRSNYSLDEASSEKATRATLSDGTPAEIHAAALANIEQLLTEARLGVSHRDWHTHAKNRQTGTQKETALQIHRFYTAMRYGKDVYGVKMTVREKRSGATVFYTLEAHELDVQKINPETESPRGGVVKAALPGRSPTIKYNNFFEKFKPVNDLLGFKNIRMSVFLWRIIPRMIRTISWLF